MTPADHITNLRAAGMTIGDIADASGVSVSTLGRICRNRNATPSTADAILAVPIPGTSTPTCHCRWTPASARNPRIALATHRNQAHPATEPLESPNVLRGGRWTSNGRGTVVWKEELT